MSDITIIVGTSGTGKSTIYKSLQKDFCKYAVHDIDEEGVPKEPSREWRKRRTNELLEKASAYSKQGKKTVLCGVMVPSEVRSSSSFDKSINTRFIFLYLDAEAIKNRLLDRGWSKEKIDGNLNWAKHFEKLMSEEKNYTKINVTNMDKNSVLKEIVNIIEENN